MTLAAKPELAADRDALAFDVVQDFIDLTPKSHAMFERARKSLTGGTTGNLRFFRPYPLYFERAEGATMTDIDGRTYIDMFCTNGPTMLGHRHPALEAAMDAQRAKGSILVNPTLAVEAAEAVKDLVPCAETVRFLNTGTEAVISAVRYARAFTGKSKIVKFGGHYHGQADAFLQGVVDDTTTWSAGVPKTANIDTLILPFNRVDLVKNLISQRDDIAAFILDPSQHAGGLWGARKEFLQEIRELTRETGILLMFDEVITGFRLMPGGAQSYFGVTPDLAIFGKALAAGEKLSAVAGRADIMAVVDPMAVGGSTVFQSGTSNDGTRALASAIAALREYGRQGNAGYKALTDRASDLAKGMKRSFDAAGIEHRVNQMGPMLQLFVGGTPTQLSEVANSNDSARELLLLAMVNEGQLLTLPTSNHIYLSFAHTDQHVTKMLAALDRAIERYSLRGDAFGKAKHNLRLQAS